MNGETRPERTALPLDVLDQIDRICDRFEATWEAGQRPRVEDYLGAVAEPYQPDLLCDLLAAELDARRRRGERPEPHEYLDRFPGEAAVDRGGLRVAVDPAIPASDSRTSPPSLMTTMSLLQGRVPPRAATSAPGAAVRSPRRRAMRRRASTSERTVMNRESDATPPRRRCSIHRTTVASCPAPRSPIATASCRWWAKAAWARSTGPTT